MSQQERALRIGPEVFKSSVCCTGEQLTRILVAVAPVVGDLTWYCADIETDDGAGGWPAERSPHLVVVGSCAQAIRKIERTSQFLSGVFVGAPASTDLSNTEWWTDDDPFRTLQGASVEIRAFDTSYFEVYTLNGALLETVANSVGGELVGR